MAGEVNIDNSVQRQTEKLHGGTKNYTKKVIFMYCISKYSIPVCGSLKQQCRIFY